MGQGTESSETCADRPTEVSVIRFVSRNHKIEEIAPKKEAYICKQSGCGKIFSNQEEYKNHEAMEALKIRFVCREPGCGEELSDPGSMWRHYQEWHNNEINSFICPYSSCNSAHSSSENLEEHIQSCHRHLSVPQTEPEVICFEGAESNADKEALNNCKEGNDFKHENDSEDYIIEQSSQKTQKNMDELNKVSTVIPKNKDLLITKESFLVKYEDRSKISSSEIAQAQSTQETNQVIILNGDLTITKNFNQDHRIDLGNLEKVFRSGFENEASPKIEISEASDDEEYTPKKQRMSRYKIEPYKCEMNGCGKTYKYISHFRHHRDGHKLLNNVTNSEKSTKPKPKPTTISFFLCKVQGCEAQFPTSLMLYKHFNEVHKNILHIHKSLLSNNHNDLNIKTGNQGSILNDQVFHADTTTQLLNYNNKTDLKANHSNIKNDNSRSSIIKEEIDCGE